MHPGRLEFVLPPSLLGTAESVSDTGCTEVSTPILCEPCAGQPVVWVMKYLSPCMLVV